MKHNGGTKSAKIRTRLQLNGNKEEQEHVRELTKQAEIVSSESKLGNCIEKIQK